MLESFDINWTGVLLPSLVLVLGFFSYKVLQKFFDLSKNKNTNVVLQKQLTNIVFILLLIIIFVIVLPIKDSLKNQIIKMNSQSKLTINTCQPEIQRLPQNMKIRKQNIRSRKCVHRLKNNKKAVYKL